MPRKAANVPADETKGAKFVRLANARVSAALKALDAVKGLGNKSVYDYTDDQVSKIETALTARITEVTASLKAGKASAAGGFTLG